MTVELYDGDCLEVLSGLPAGSVQMCVTSPPYYGQRDYGMPGQIGLEEHPELFVQKLSAVFREVLRVLNDDGTFWLVIGDTYYQGNKGSSGELNPTEKQSTNAGSIAMRRGESLSPARRNKFAGLKPKDLIGIPWMLAFSLRDDGWFLRSEIIWSKPNGMPESVDDRPTKSHEKIFLLSKSPNYYYDAKAIAEPAQVWGGQAAIFERSGPGSTHVNPGQTRSQHLSRNGHNSFRGQGAHRKHETGKAGRESRDKSEIGTGPTRNKRDVWSVAVRPYRGPHFATFPPALIVPCILAGSRPGDTVLDPFSGSGTTGAVAVKWQRNYIGIDLNPKYNELARRRLAMVQIASPELMAVGDE